MSDNPKVKAEAQRALANIKSYNLKVFAFTANLGENLADIDEDSNNKKKKDVKLEDETKDDDEDEDEDEREDNLLSCLNMIQEAVPTCSVLLITEMIDSLRILTRSVNPDLKGEEWLEAAAKNVQGSLIEMKNLGENAVELTLKMNEGASTIKEKENALAASFAFLRSKGLSEDSDDEGEIYNLDDI